MTNHSPHKITIHSKVCNTVPLGPPNWTKIKNLYHDFHSGTGTTIRTAEKPAENDKQILPAQDGLAKPLLIFAHALLMDGREAMDAGLMYSWEVAEHFGIPDEVVRLQPPLVLQRQIAK